MNTPAEHPSLVFSELVVGDRYVSVGRTVTEADIQNFAGISGDFNLLHTDEEWVRANTPFRGRIAHGLLILAMSSGIRTPGYDDLDIQAYLSATRDMTAPTYPGDTITVTNIVAELRPSRSKPGHGIGTFDVEVTNQHREVVQRGTDILLIGPGPGSPTDSSQHVSPRRPAANAPSSPRHESPHHDQR